MVLRFRNLLRKSLIEQTKKHRASIAIAFLLLGAHHILGHKHLTSFKGCIGTLSNIYRMSAHPLKEYVKVPLLRKERLQSVVMLIYALEVLLLALFVGCTRSNLIKYNLRLSIISVDVVAICYKYRLYTELIVCCIVTIIKKVLQGRELFSVYTVCLILVCINLIVYRIKALLQAFHIARIFGYPVCRACTKDQHTAIGVFE